MNKINNRFDLVFEDTAEEHLEKKEKESEELKKAAEEERREVEKKGLCQGCHKLGYCRWIYNDECYLCWECFIQDLQCQADACSPYTRTTDRPGYISRNDWEEQWEFNE